jgi:hypothetical protein
MAPRWSGQRRHPLSLLCGVVLAGCVLIALGAADARAATSYSSSGGFGSAGSGLGQFNGPSKVAVDDATGNVLVVDRDNGRVNVFGPGGGSAAALTDFGTGDLSSPTGIAVDQVSHAVYVSDSTHILRYTSDGLPTPTYTLDISFASLAQGNATALAVDPSTQDLLVADAANNLVSRYDATGFFLGSFDGSDSPDGAFTGLLDVAADAGHVYVVDSNGTDPVLAGGTSRAMRFTAAGAYDLGYSSVPTPTLVTIDANSGQVLIGGNNALWYDPAGTAVYVFAGSHHIVDVPYPVDGGNNTGRMTGLAVDGGASGRLYVAGEQIFGGYAGTVGVQAFDPVALPDVVLDAPGAVTATAAHVSGSVNSFGQASTTYRFELSKDGTSWTVAASGSIGTDVVPEQVAADLAALEPNTSYRLRLVGVNGAGSLASDERPLTTPASAPGIVANAASDRSPTGATLRSSVNPFGLQTTYHFEYGLTTDYGSRTPVGREDVAGNGRTGRAVQSSVTGLLPGTTYHYRLVAENSAGRTAGDDRSFTTRTPEGDRAYELVTPAEKAGTNADTFMNFQASRNGDSVAYGTKIAFPIDAAVAAPLHPKYLAGRGAAGWTSTPIDPPQIPGSAPKSYTTSAVSEDGTKAVVLSLKKLADGAVDGDSNVYLRDIATGAYTTIATSPGPMFDSNAWYAPPAWPAYVAGTADFSHVVLNGLCCSLLPGTPAGSLYEWSAGKLRVASVDRDGTPFSGGNDGGGIMEHEANRISDDGTRIFFGGSDGAVYVRRDGTTTEPVSVSHRTGDDDAPRPARFAGASKNGRYAFIVSTAPLTNDSDPGDHNGVLNLYRYDVDQHTLTLVASPLTSREDVFQVSAGGDYVYFGSGNAIAPGAVQDEPNLYVWHSGQVHHVTTLALTRDPNSLDIGFLASPNGRYFIFAAHSALTGYDNATPVAGCGQVENVTNACAQLYRYDAEQRSLTCASCPPDGAKAVSNASIGWPTAEFSRHFPRAVIDDGRVFFDTAQPLSSRDANSSRDVYSFDGDEAMLISAGTGSGDSHLSDVSPDGRNVFFTTQDQLVGTDRDTLTDVYDARVGGGLARDNPEEPRGTCADEDCRGAGAGPVLPAPPTTETPQPPGGSPASSAKAKLTVLSAKFTGTTLHLRVSVSGSGRIRASGSKLAATTRTTSRAGNYTLRVPLTKKQRAARRSGRRVKAGITVSFTPAFGKHVTAKFTRTASR